MRESQPTLCSLARQVACSRKGLENNCPKTCRHAETHTCGNGCSGLLAQQLPGAKHSSCWSVGQWGGGKKVSVSLLDPTDPEQGVVYTMLQGDTKGCPANTARTFSLAVRCPGVGMPVRRVRLLGRSGTDVGQAMPVMNVSSLGNCAYVRPCWSCASVFLTHSARPGCEHDAPCRMSHHAGVARCAHAVPLPLHLSHRTSQHGATRS